MTADHEQLISMLTRLKLTAVRDRLDTLLDEASRQQMTLRETVFYLCKQEIQSKDQKRIQMGISMAKFPYARTLDQFDYEAQPSIDPAQIRELSTCRWVANGDTLLLLGPPGVGKTHLAVGLGREAVLQGYTVLFTSATVLLTQLTKAHLEGKLDEKISQYSKAKLLIIDELGYLPFDPKAAHLFFQLISSRYEKGSVLITSNRAIGEWGDVFGDPTVATAILDRLLHHSYVITIRGESYRLKEKRKSGLVKSTTNLKSN
jgi:DNA replication protein DnaC